MNIAKLFLATVVVMVGCSQSTLKVSKDDARQMGGKSDTGMDICESAGWYDDGECDEFCPMPDPDCGNSCTSASDCSPIFCITAPCPENRCVDGACVVVPAMCQPVTCELFCENGFETGADGCEVCSCKPPTMCPPVVCALACENGFAKGDDGCEVCRCNPPSMCEPLACDLDCPTGFQKDANGCDTCRCNPPQCEPVTCEIACPNGFATGDDGCEICECRGSCETDGSDSCAQGSFCLHRPEQCGGPGRCMEVPDVCNRQFAPVCGCDGKDYGNACGAHAASQSVASDGPCMAGCQPVVCALACENGFKKNDDGCEICECETARACGGFAGRMCDDGQYCLYDDRGCGIADGGGTCQPIPPRDTVCPAVVDPVCGCDRKTYNNSCEAAKAGVSVARAGRCP